MLTQISEYELDKTYLWKLWAMVATLFFFIVLGFSLWVCYKIRNTEFVFKEERLIRCIQIEKMEPGQPYFIELKGEE